MVADKVGGGQTHWLFGHLARPVITWLVTTSAKSMELPHGPINTPILVKVYTHTTFW
jgi:hypothetical protein